MAKCHLCYGDGHRCWTCGEADGHCECDDPNQGECDLCEGTGEEDDRIEIAEKRRAIDERNAEIRRRKADGEQSKDIAASLGVCLSVVHKLLAEPKP